MTKERVYRNGEAATDLIAAVVANVTAFHKKVSRVYGDVGRLRTKVEATHRNVDRLHRKIEGTHARIRIFRSQGRVQRRGAARPVEQPMPSCHRIELTPFPSCDHTFSGGA